MKFQISSGDQLDHKEEEDPLQLVVQIVQKARFIMVLLVEVYGKLLTLVLHGKIFQMDILVDL